MLTLYTWTTPNGRKIPILLEELGIPYEIKPVNIGKDEQFTPEFLALSPNNKIPALTDTDADGNTVSSFESAAILTFLAERTPHAHALLEHGNGDGTPKRHWTYAELAALIDETAALLRALAIRPGDRLMVVGENCVAQLVQQKRKLYCK